MLKLKNLNFTTIKLDLVNGLGKSYFKYFIDYKDVENVKPLCIMLPKMSGRTWSFNETKCISFLIEDNELLQNYNKIWNKVCKCVWKGFDNKPTYNKKYLRTKIKSYEDEINTIFHNDRMPKEGSHCICVSVTLFDSVFNNGKFFICKCF